MKVWAQCYENTVRPTFPRRFCFIWTGRYGRGICFICLLAGYTLNATTMQTGVVPRLKCAIILADAAAIKVRLCYLDFSQVPSTADCRRSLPLAPYFQSQYIDIQHCLFLDQTSWLQKGRNGKNIERSPHPHSRRSELPTLHLLDLNAITREITNWCGMRPSAL